MNNDSISCQRKTVIFLHIPKTGGLTFTQIARQNYPERSVYEIRRGNQQEFARFQHLSCENLKKIKFLAGHFGFGIHEYLPNPVIYITLLREPIKRVISAYFYIRSTPNHPLYKQVIVFNSLENFLEAKKWFDNQQVRMLAGKINVSPIECSTEEMLEIAKYNLDKFFPIFGITENFDEFLILCQKNLNWQSIFYQKINVTKKYSLKEEISSKALEIIKSKNALDIALYDYAKEKFAQKFRESNLEFDTNLFKFSNQIYQQTYPSHELIRRSLQKVKKLANSSGASS